MRIFLLAAALALVPACLARGPAAGQPEARSATAGLGETAEVGGIAVTPLAVLEDSRCPSDVTCVWAGRVRIRARIETAAGANVIEMQLGVPVAAGNERTIALVSVRPERRSGTAVELSAYRFAFGESAT